MNKISLRPSLLAVAALLSLVGVAHAEDVTVYGAIGLDVRYATGVATPSGSKSVMALEDNAIVNSRVGIKGGEDLGGGLKAFFDLESSIAPDTGKSNATAFWNRNAFVGLSGAFGTVKLGHQWNVADDYMCSYFVCAYYSPFLMSGFGALSDYYDNTIKYTSPNMGGFEGAAMYTLGEQAGKQSAGQKFQAAVNYGSGPFGVGAVVFSEKNTAGTDTNTMYAVGGSYDFGTAKLRLGLATADVKYTTAFKATLIDIGVDVPLNEKTTVSADYVQKDVSSSSDDTSFLRLRAGYALSKRTSLNANLIFLSNGGNASFGFAGAAEAGKGQTILTAGITHSF
jgi:predicted porin